MRLQGRAFLRKVEHVIWLDQNGPILFNLIRVILSASDLSKVLKISPQPLKIRPRRGSHRVYSFPCNYDPYAEAAARRSDLKAIRMICW
jgi:hypothetical protein